MALEEPLTPSQLASWKQERILLLRGFLDPVEAARAQEWTTELASRPETPGKWMLYFEQTPAADGEHRTLCRIENFVPFHPGFADLLLGEQMLAAVSQLLGEKALLFKDKINFKLPGGAAFRAHQDGPAFSEFIDYSITMMLAIDAATPENGGLEVAKGRFSEALPQNPDGTLSEETIAQIEFLPVPLYPGDALLFDSNVPHRSPANRGTSLRRAVFATFNRAMDGDLRDAYFCNKRKVFPPECERVPGTDYSAAESVYNLGNPIN